MKSRKFADSATLYARAGNGGNGSASFRREKYVPKGGPDGGDGGRGGHVILKADKSVDSLIRIYFEPHRKAPHGGHGSGQQRHGKNGTDLVLNVPCGTEIFDKETGRLIEDLVEDGTEVIVAKGGKGGLGNVHWKSATHQTPREFTPGIKGEEATLYLNLKLVADIGLVGFPNAGKSSILTAISDAHPKIAAYPFTTLNPIIGTIEFENYSRITIADIPGIIKGAHEGTGLGVDFLKHIERASALVYVIDMAGVDQRKPSEDYQCLQDEMHSYRQELLSRPSIVVANKMDLPEAAQNIKEFRRLTKTRPLEMSAINKQGIDKLRKSIQEMTGNI